MGALRGLLVLGSAVITLSWLGCGGAAAIATAPFLDPHTSDLVHEARDLADHIHRHHFFDDEASTYEDHCEAHDRYDELSVSFDAAVVRGDIFAAQVIGDALADLGERSATTNISPTKTSAATIGVSAGSLIISSAPTLRS